MDEQWAGSGLSQAKGERHSMRGQCLQMLSGKSVYPAERIGYDHSRRFVLARTLVRPASQEVGIAGISLGITRGLDVSSRDRGDNKERRSLRKVVSPQTC